jgi:hypothetical protein
MNEDISLISQYIRENRHTYTREAINKQLLDKGHAPSDIVKAWETIQLSEEVYGSRIGGRNVAGQPLFWAVVIGFVVASYSMPALLGAFLSNESSVSLVIFLVIIGAGLIAGFTFREYNRPVGTGFLVGAVIAIALPAVGFALFFGLCIFGYVF